MKLEDVKIGLEVRLTDDGTRGKIKSLPDVNGRVRFKWDGGTVDDIRVDRLAVIDLEADKKLATEMQTKIDAATTAFEQAFKALQELNILDSNPSVIAFQDEGLVSLAKLEHAVETFGWSTSSLYC
jgi:hypothetical protein